MTEYIVKEIQASANAVKEQTSYIHRDDIFKFLKIRDTWLTSQGFSCIKYGDFHYRYVSNTSDINGIIIVDIEAKEGE